MKATQPEFPIDALDALQQQSKRNLDRMNLRDQPMRPQRALDDPHIFAPYPDERRDTAGPRRRHKDNCDAKPLPALPRSSLSMAAAGSTMTTMHGGHGLSTYSMRQPNSLSMNPDFTPNVYAQPDSSLTGFVPPMSAASLHTRRGTANNLVGSQLDFPGVALKPSRRGIPGPFEHTDPFRGGPYGYNTLSYSDAERGSNPNNFASGSSHYGRSGAFRSNQGY